MCINAALGRSAPRHTAGSMANAGMKTWFWPFLKPEQGQLSFDTLDESNPSACHPKIRGLPDRN